MKLAKNLENLGTESAFAVLAEANKLLSEGKDIINLGIGQPDFKTPNNIVEAAIKALKDGKEAECSLELTRNGVWTEKNC